MKKRNGNLFMQFRCTCRESKGEPQNRKEFADHLHNVHHIADFTTMKAEKALLKETKGLEWLEQTYQWRLEDGSVFYQYVRLRV